MRAYYGKDTYTVTYNESDAQCFTRHTDTPKGIVTGDGAFVFDTLTGNLVDRKGTAVTGESSEWLAFSQDAQEFGREELARTVGVQVNPYPFGSHMVELAQNPKGKKRHPYVGRRVELTFTSDPFTKIRPGLQGTVSFVDDTGTVHVNWDDGSVLGLVPGEDHFQFISASNPTARISRTRGVKTMRGPYSAARGYEPWIQRRGKLGEGFLTTMTKSERHKALDRCVDEYGYRSCLGSILVLERAKKGPRDRGEGVGVKYAKQLKESREYLKKKYGGPGSFGPQKKERVATAADKGGAYRASNPPPEEHAARSLSFLEAGEKAMRDALAHYERWVHGGGPRGGPERERAEACTLAEQAYRYAVLAEHESQDGHMSDAKLGRFLEAAAALTQSSRVVLSKCGGFVPEHRHGGGKPALTLVSSNPYQGDAFARAKYKQERGAWEQSGRHGPPPRKPKSKKKAR